MEYVLMYGLEPLGQVDKKDRMMRRSASVPARKTPGNSFRTTNRGELKPVEVKEAFVKKEEKKIQNPYKSDDSEDDNVFTGDVTINDRDLDSGCPSASSGCPSDEDTPTLPDESYSYLTRQQSLNISLGRALSRQVSSDSQSESDQSEVYGYSYDQRFKPRFQRQLNSSSTEGHYFSKTNQRCRKSSMYSSTESLDSSDSAVGNLSPGVERMLGKLRRGPASFYRSGTDNTVPLYLSKCYERPTRYIERVKKGSNANVMGGQAPKLDLEEEQCDEIEKVIPARRGYRRGMSVDNFIPAGTEIIENVIRLTANDISQLSTEEVEKLRNISNNPSKDEVINLINLINASTDSSDRLRRKYSGITKSYRANVPIEVELKTKIKESIMKFRPEQTITGIAKLGLKRCQRTGSRTVQSQPTSRRHSLAGVSADVDREMALAFRKAFENAPWIIED